MNKPDCKYAGRMPTEDMVFCRHESIAGPVSLSRCSSCPLKIAGETVPVPDVKRVRTQKPCNCGGRTLNLETAFTGMGDAMMLAWLPEFGLYLTGQKVQLLSMFGISPAGCPTCAIDLGEAVGLEGNDDYRKSRLAYIQESLGTDYTPARPIKAIPHNAWVDARLQEWGEKVIVLCPQSQSASRETDASLWLSLYESFQQMGYVVCVFLLHKQPVFDDLENVFWGQPIENMVCMMDRASCVIGVDSGPMHIAGSLGVPSVALMTVTNGQNVFGHCADVMTCLTDLTLENVLAAVRGRIGSAPVKVQEVKRIRAARRGQVRRCCGK